MEKIIEMLCEFNILSTVVRLVLAVLVGGFIGAERGRHGRAAGMRTHILVCVGSAVTALTGLFVAEATGNSGDVLRISAQVISGIGFLGVGTIIVRNRSIVTGLTTAAVMWATAVIGIAVGYGFYIGAFVATVLCIFTTTVLNRTERKTKNVLYIYVEMDDMTKTDDVINKLKNIDPDSVVDIISPKSGHSGHIGLLLTIRNDGESSIDIKNEIKEYDGVLFAAEQNGI